MVNLDRIPHGKVGLGSSVELKDTATGEDVFYEIVTPEEADPTVGRISPSSPIGRCLLGHEEGDVVQVKVPSGSREFELVKLVTIHDQAAEAAAGGEDTPAE
jgi:transcription elongation GreA/GreB family factor